MLKKIVVGTDGSNTARVAVDHAVELAEATGARLFVVTGFKHGGTSPFEGSTIELGRRILDEVKERFRDRVTMLTDVREDSPAKALIKTAKEQDADLIVVGSVGMDKDTRLTAGSIPNEVSHHAPCNVLIVHTG